MVGSEDGGVMRNVSLIERNGKICPYRRHWLCAVRGALGKVDAYMGGCGGHRCPPREGVGGDGRSVAEAGSGSGGRFPHLSHKCRRRSLGVFAGGLQ